MKKRIFVVLSVLLIAILMVLGTFKFLSEKENVFTEDIPKSWSIPSEDKI